MKYAKCAENKRNYCFILQTGCSTTQYSTFSHVTIYLSYLLMFSVIYDARLWFPSRQFNRVVQQCFVINYLFDLDAAVSADYHLWLAQKKNEIIRCG